MLAPGAKEETTTRPVFASNPCKMSIQLQNKLQSKLNAECRDAIGAAECENHIKTSQHQAVSIELCVSGYVECCGVHEPPLHKYKMRLTDLTYNHAACVLGKLVTQEVVLAILITC